MKTNTHPQYQPITISCACGNTFQAGSTLSEDLRVEICSNCHPLYTGKAKLIDAAGRVDKFQARQQRAAEHQKAAEARSAKKADQPAKEEKESK